MHVELLLASGLCAVLLIVPLVRFVNKQDFSAAALVAWLWVINVVFFVDATFWARSTDIQLVQWCIFSTKLIIGLSIALPASALSICIDLERPFVSPEARPLPRTARSKWFVQAMLCIVVPVVYMLISIITQDRRFDLIEDIGCRPSIFMSSPAIALLWLPPWVISLACFGAVWFAIRPGFPRTYQGQGASQSVWSQLRPVILALSVVGWTFAVSILALVYAVLSGGGVHSWPGLGAVHAHGGSVRIYNVEDTPSSTRSLQLLLWWAVPLTSLLVLAFTLPVASVRERFGRSSKPSPTARVLKLVTTDLPTDSKRAASPASSVSTIRFGPAASDYFTMPDFSGSLPPVPASWSNKPVPAPPAVHRKPSLPSFLVLGEREREDSTDSAFADFAQTLPNLAGLSANRPSDTSALTGIPSVVASTHNSCVSLERKQSVPVSVTTRDSLRHHISVSSARYSVRHGVPARPSVPDVPVMEPMPDAPVVTSRNRFGMLLPGRSRTPRPSGDSTKEFELELSAPPRVYRPFLGLGRGRGQSSKDSAIFMTVVDEV